MNKYAKILVVRADKNTLETSARPNMFAVNSDNDYLAHSPDGVNVIYYPTSAGVNSQIDGKLPNQNLNTSASVTFASISSPTITNLQNAISTIASTSLSAVVKNPTDVQTISGGIIITNTLIPLTIGTSGTGLEIYNDGEMVWANGGNLYSPSANFLATDGSLSAVNLSASTINVGNVSNTEFEYLDGVSANIQTQLNGKQSTLTNPVTGIGNSGRVAYWNGTNTLTSTDGFRFDGTKLSIPAQGGDIYAQFGYTSFAGNLAPGAFSLSGYTGNLIGWNRAVGSRRFDFVSNVSNTSIAHGFDWWSNSNGSWTNLAGLSHDGKFNLPSLTASRVVVTDSSKNLASSSITSTELGYLTGTSANIQTQLTNLSATNSLLNGVGYPVRSEYYFNKSGSIASNTYTSSISLPISANELFYGNAPGVTYQYRYKLRASLVNTYAYAPNYSFSLKLGGITLGTCSASSTNEHIWFDVDIVPTGASSFDTFGQCGTKTGIFTCPFQVSNTFNPGILNNLYVVTYGAGGPGECKLIKFEIIKYHFNYPLPAGY